MTPTNGWVAMIIASLMATEISGRSGFGIVVSDKANAATDAKLTIDYQKGQNRYSCVIDGAPHHETAYTCESKKPIGQCAGSDFMQISLGDNDPNDALSFDSIIFDGREIDVEGPRWNVGEDADTYKRRYYIGSGRVVGEDKRPQGYDTPKLVPPECDHLPAPKHHDTPPPKSDDPDGFGFIVCDKSFSKNAVSNAEYTIDYQVDNNRYTCVIDGAREFEGVYTCKSKVRKDQCAGSHDFMQISGDHRDDVAYCAIIFDGEEIAVPAEWKVGDDAGTYKRRYYIDSGKIVEQELHPVGHSSTKRVAPKCDPLPIKGFGFRVCDHKYGDSVAPKAKITVDYQVGIHRYSCVIDGVHDYNGVYTCKSKKPKDSCLNGDFLQLNTDSNDDLGYCSIIFDGKEIEVDSARHDRLQLGNDAGTYKRRYDMEYGKIVGKSAHVDGFTKRDRVVPECCQYVECYEPRC